jgi:PAS domain S-box-containing protein
MTSSVVSTLVHANDVVIAVCYMMIPLMLLFVVRTDRLRVDLPTKKHNRNLVKHVLTAYMAFIMTCGLTHLWRFTDIFFVSDAVTLTLLTMCSVASVYTVCLLLLKYERLSTMYAKMGASSDDGNDYKIAFKQALECTSDMVSIHTSSNLKFMHVNNACTAYGYTKEMLKGVPFTQIVHEEDVTILESVLCVQVRDTEEFVRMFRIKTADNLFVHVEAAFRWGQIDDTPVFFAVTRNIEARMQRFGRDLEVQNEKIRVETSRVHAMTLAHDLRTPLAVFDLAIRNLRDKVRDRNDLNACESSLWFMKLVVDRTIDSCRVLQGDMPSLTYEHVNLKDLVRNTLHLLDNYPKSVTITANLDMEEEDIKDFVCDDDCLWSILVNFLTNAADNTMEGSITLNIWCEGSLIMFEVVDTGVGINPLDRERLFCPFQKFTNKLKPSHGIGLGLYNNAWRIRLLGGSYSMRPNPQDGSIFAFSLPLRRRSTALPIRRPSGNTGSIYDNIKVLVVDDTALFRQMFVKQLKIRGVTLVEEASDGDQGLQCLMTNHYDIAFIDLHMQAMNGDEVIRQFRAHETSKGIFPKTFCVIMTADVVHSDSYTMADDFLNKPIKIKLVMSMIHNHLVA